MPYFSDNYREVSYPIAEGTSDGLRNAQIGAIHAIAAYFTLKSDPTMVVLPTGSGKTAVMLLTPFVLRAKRVLVVTPSRMVRTQIRKQFESLAILKKLMAIYEGVAAPRVYEVEGKVMTTEAWAGLRDYDVVVGTPNSTSPKSPGVALPPPELFDLILIDEAHHSPASTWNCLLEAFPAAKRVLFTATPYRRDQKHIQAKLIYSYPLKKAYEDGIFSEIEYVPVNTTGDSDVEIAIAAESQLLADRSAGYNHCLMVRTDRISRAKQLMQKYQQHTGLRLQLIHSGYSTSYIEKTLRKLADGDLDGVVCVAMLGEGFDFPQLKVAAIHTPHKSLEVTLQFIGRFARTNAPNIGRAKFLAIPSEVAIERTHLYRSGAIWQQLILELSGQRADEEVSMRETIDSFNTQIAREDEAEDLSLYALKPYYHVRVAELKGGFNADANVVLPQPYQVIYHQISSELNASVVLSKKTDRPRWATSDSFAKIQYDLFVIYYDASSNLMFINASSRNDELYDHIATLYGQSQFRWLPLCKIDKVLVDLENPDFFNIGMRLRFQNSGSESYRTITGRRANRALSPLDGMRYNRGHVFGGADEAGSRITIGYSSSAKVWSNRNRNIAQLISWCRTIAERISSDRVSDTKTELQYLTLGEIATSIPGGCILVDWDPDVYDHPPIVEYNYQGATVEEQLLDFDLAVDRANTSSNSIRVRLSNGSLEWSLAYSLNDGFEWAAAPEIDLVLKRRSSTLTLLEYLRGRPCSFYFADLSRLCGDEIFRSNLAGTVAFDRQRIEPVDWASNNVDITREFGSAIDGMMSIHAYIGKRLVDGSEDVVYYDHGSGEIADFITVRQDGDIIQIGLYHCKASTSPHPSDRVNDVYDVCAQAVKCLKWMGSCETLPGHMRRRERGDGSRGYLKGDHHRLENLTQLTRSLQTHFEIVIVQPGISRADLSANNAHVLAAADEYVRSARCERFRVMGSDM